MLKIFHLNSIVFILSMFEISYIVGGPLEIHEGEAKVELIRKRLRRSTERGRDAIIANNNIDEDHPSNYEYDVRVSAFGISHDLKLKPAGSIFSSNFKYHEIYTNESGHVVWKDITPSLERLEELEDNIYHDVHTNTVVKVEHLSNGELNLNGIVNDAKIRKRRQDSSHVIQIPSPTHSEILQNPPDRNIKDYIEVPLPPEGLTPRQNVVPGQLMEPELSIVIEKTLGDSIEGDVLEYMAIMIKSINSKYALTQKDLDIKCKFVGLHRMKDETSQDAFMSPGRAPNGQYDLAKVLEAFQKWANEPSNKQNLGDHDISPLQLGVEFTENGLRGLGKIEDAATPGACRFNVAGRGSLACPCSQDKGGHFAGAFTIAHEIAHNLGAPHDGDKDAAKCPWLDGFIMSYEGWGTLQHFKLSPCSLETIHNYTSKTQAKCLFESTGRPSIKSSPLEIGDKITPEQICKKEKGPTATVRFQPPDDSCRNTKCFVGSSSISTTNIPPGDNTLCGNGGACRNGYCVGQGPPKSLDEICIIFMKHPNAKFDQTAQNTSPNNEICGEIKFASKIPCILVEGRQISTLKPDLLGMILPPGTVCDSANDKICFDKQCVSRGSITHPEIECILYTGKMEAVKETATVTKCSGGDRCRYGSESESLKPINDGDTCTLDSGGPGKCFKGECKAPITITTTTTTPPSPIESTTENGKNSKTPKNFFELCSVLTNDPNARVVNQIKVLSDYDNLCKELRCRTNGREERKQIPDGFICGPLRRCKNGNCVKCGQ